MGVVANVADRVAVMYAGKIVEYGDVDEIFFNPQHPYTWGLIGSMPTLDTAGKLVSIPGTPPDLLDPPKGDAFALRSEYAMEIDYEEEPTLFQVSPRHAAATWLLHPDAPAVEAPAEIQRRYKIYESLSKGIVPEGYNDGAPQAELDEHTEVVTSADTEGVIATGGVDMEGDDAID